MSTYYLTIFRQSRALIIIFLLPIVVLVLIIIGTHTNLFISLLTLIAFCFLAYYFIVGHLKVVIQKETLFFSWTPKLLFNFRNIDPIPLNAIEIIVLDKGRFLRKLKTVERSVLINTTKIQVKDAHKFILRLQQEAKLNGARIIDSWEEWKEKGRINTAYNLTVAVLIIGAIAVIFVAITKGLSVRIFAVLSAMLVLFYYLKEMKGRM
jgi:hypothetical protein